MNDINDDIFKEELVEKNQRVLKDNNELRITINEVAKSLEVLPELTEELKKNMSRKVEVEGKVALNNTSRRELTKATADSANQVSEALESAVLKIAEQQNTFQELTTKQNSVNAEANKNALDQVKLLSAAIQKNNHEIEELCEHLLERKVQPVVLHRSQDVDRRDIPEDIDDTCFYDAQFSGGGGASIDLSVLEGLITQLTECCAESLTCLQAIKALLEAGIDVNIANWDEMNLGIEASLAPVGCVKDAEGLVTGKVFICKKVDEATGAETYANLLVETNGTVTNPYTGAWEDCPATDKTIQCWKDKFIEGGLDNTFTRFEHTNQVFTVTFDNGDVDTFNVASATGWTDQVQQMATGLGSIMPWAQTVDPFCTNGCGNLPAPFVQLNKMVWRYVGFRVCPGDKVPVSVAYTSDQREKPVELVIQYVETDTIFIDRCTDCDGNEEFTVDGQPYTPVCAIPCEEEFDETPLTTCEITYLDGCDNVNSENNSDFVPIIRAITDCGSGPEVTYLQDLNNALEDYTLVGQFVDCATGQPIIDACGTDNGFVEKLCDCIEGDNCTLDVCNIYSPASATSNATSFNPATPVENHINLSGLNSPFTNGQDFVAYDPANQAHVTTWNGNETYLELAGGISATTPLTITYDLGFIGTWNKIAFWTEEAHPATTFNVEYSLDGVTWTASQAYTIGTNPITGGYGATVLDIDCAFTAQYIRFNHTDTGTYRPENDLLAIGEIAFGGTDNPPKDNFECIEFYREHTANGYCDYTLEDGIRTPYVVVGEVQECADDDGLLDKLCEIAENTAPVVDCDSELTSEPQCVQGDQLNVPMSDGSTRNFTAGDYITVVQEFDCLAQLITVKYYETVNPDVTIDISGGLPNWISACSPEPTVSERCIVDAKGQQWIVTEYRDVDGIILGTPFYLLEDGTIGTPAGDPKEWTSCSDCCPTIESREVCIKTDDGIVPALAVVEVSDVATNVLRIEDAIGTELTGEIVDCNCDCDDDDDDCVDVFTEAANCTADAGCTVFKDFSHKGGTTSLQTIQNAQIIRQSCNGAAVTTTGIGTTVEDVANGVNTNLETWINTNLGPFGFAASPATVNDPNNNGSPMSAFMNLKYPTCSPWTFTVLNTPTHYSSTSPLFSGVKYTFDGTNLLVELVDASGNVVATPPANTAGNLGTLPLQDC